MPKNSSSKGSRKAFTLIELLCVIAIIAQLAAILFPVFARARETARRASCQGNLKQIGLGLMQYTQDYDERVPSQQWGMGNQDGQDVADYAKGNSGVAGTPSVSGNNWIVAVQPYVKSWQVFRCPTAVSYNKDTWTDYKVIGESETNYVVNGNAMSTVSGTTPQARLLASIPEVSTLIWAHERPTRTSHAFLRPYFSEVRNGKAWFQEGMYDGLTIPEGKYFDTVHFDGGNLLFLDGHVKWRKLSQICSADFGIEGTTCGGDINTGGGNALF
jgi:prepilin-type N-terminal cleavage/methylation domain-containing protein/prepilin-type processing-associated H-X9-DG protein